MISKNLSYSQILEVPEGAFKFLIHFSKRIIQKQEWEVAIYYMNVWKYKWSFRSHQNRQSPTRKLPPEITRKLPEIIRI